MGSKFEQPFSSSSQQFQLERQLQLEQFQQQLQQFHMQPPAVAADSGALQNACSDRPGSSDRRQPVLTPLRGGWRHQPEHRHSGGTETQTSTSKFRRTADDVGATDCRPYVTGKPETWRSLGPQTGLLHHAESATPRSSWLTLQGTAATTPPLQNGVAVTAWRQGRRNCTTP